MDRMRSALIILAVLLTGLLGNSCNDGNKGRDSAAAPEAAAAPGPVAQTGDDNKDQPCGTQGSAETAAQVDPDQAAGADSASEIDADGLLDRHWQETAIEFKNPLSISMELRSAEFNPVEKATMSTLGFEASCQIGRKDWLRKEIVMDSLKSTDSAVLDLDICSVELMPLLKTPVITGRTSTGGTVLTMEGGLRFIVRDPAGETMGTFLVNNEGELYEAENGELYSWRISKTDQKMLPSQYLFFRTPGVGDPIHYIVAISYQHGTSASKIVKDPLGNEIKYNFPNGSVEIGPPDPPERKRRNPDDDYRK